MNKSIWLISAGAIALAAPAHAQNNSTPVGTATPTEQAAEVNTKTDVNPNDDIVITANGRSQILQDVPIAVSAVSADRLQNTGANDIRQLNQLAPSLLVSSTGTEANGSARIRGIGTVGDNPGLESSVAVFIDGVYRSRSGIGLNELGEVERIEVLRGPQGTLFGRNASAGLISIITKKPNLNDSEGYGEASYGNYDNVRLAGGVTGPIGDSGFAYRIDGVYNNRDGFYKDVVDGQRHNDRDRYFVRGQLLYEPSSDLSIRVIGDYTHRNEDCCAAVYVDTREKFDPTPGTPGDYDVAASNRIVDILHSLGGVLPSDGHPYNRLTATTPGRSFQNKTEDYGISGQVDYNLGFGSLTSITAYREYKSGNAGDLDYGNVDIYYRADDGNAYRQFKTFSQEVRLQGSAFNDHLDWLVGGYYAHEDLKLVDNARFGTQYGEFAACRIVATVNPAAVLRDPTAPGCLSPTGRGALAGAFGALAPVILGGIDRLSTLNNLGDVDSQYKQRSTNYALFTHNIISITDKLSLTLGARYTHERKSLNADFDNNNTICPAQQAALDPYLLSPMVPASAKTLIGGILTLTCTGNSSSTLNGLDIRSKRKEGEWTGTGILSYKPNRDLLFYASYAKGYKAGGFNLDRSDLGTGPGQNPALFPRSNADADGLQFSPEKVDSYEIGGKFSVPHFTLDIAAFREVFDNFQLNTFNGTVFIVQNINSCSTDLDGADSDQDSTTGGCAPGKSKSGVTSTGVELEGSWTPLRDLALTAGYTYADTHYRHNLIGSSNGEPLDPALFLLPGQQLSNAPKNVVTGSVGYTPRIGGHGLTGLFYVDARYSSHYNTGSDLFPEKEQDGYTLVNARIGIRGPEQKWSLEFWGQNIFNTHYQQVAFNAPFQGSGSLAQTEKFGTTANQIFASFLAEPRTYGVTVRTRF